MKHGALTEAQFSVLVCRGKGMTQRETAQELGTSRANVSMIELRARRKVQMARQTLQAYQSTRTDHVLKVPKGIRFYDIPSTVLREADRWGVHLKSDMVDFVRMVRGIRPSCLEGGRTKRSISLLFDRAGNLRVEPPARGRRLKTGTAGQP